MDEEFKYAEFKVELAKTVDIDKYKYFISFIGADDTIIHACGYEDRPTILDFKHIFNELVQNKEYIYTHRYINSLRVYLFDYNGYKSI